MSVCLTNQNLTNQLFKIMVKWLSTLQSEKLISSQVVLKSSKKLSATHVKATTKLLIPFPDLYNVLQI